jgi:hypothetical protein
LIFGRTNIHTGALRLFLAWQRHRRVATSRYAASPTVTRNGSVAIAGIVVVVILVGTLIAAPWQRPAPPVRLADDGNPVGNDLVLTIEEITDLLGDGSVVFPANLTAAAQNYMRAVDASIQTEDEQADQALKAGGYLYGGIRLFVDAQAKDGRTYTIYDIHPVVRHYPIVTGNAVLVEPGGAGPFYPIYFDLDQRRPIAEEAINGDTTNERPFFDMQRPEVTKQEKPTFTMWFNAFSYSAVFAIDVDYDVDGQSYTETLDDHGQPFRATGTPCAAQLKQAGFAGPHLPASTTERYSSIWQLPLDGSDHPSFLPLDQSTYAGSCANY